MDRVLPFSDPVDGRANNGAKYDAGEGIRPGDGERNRLLRLLEETNRPHPKFSKGKAKTKRATHVSRAEFRGHHI